MNAHGHSEVPNVRVIRIKFCNKKQHVNIKISMDCFYLVFSSRYAFGALLSQVNSRERKIKTHS